MKLVNLGMLSLLMVCSTSLAQRPQIGEGTILTSETVLQDKAAIGSYIYAAQQGNALAQFKLGQMFLDGDLLQQDHRKALSWFTASAEQGVIQAQLLLSSMYLKGMGTAKDPLMARKWFDIAISSSERTEELQITNMHNTMVF